MLFFIKQPLTVFDFSEGVLHVFHSLVGWLSPTTYACRSMMREEFGLLVFYGVHGKSRISLCEREYERLPW